METVIKQSAGIDCGSKELVVSFGQLYMNSSFNCSNSKKFTNTTKGFKELIQWINTMHNEDVSVYYVMEATGVYHEKLAYYLVANDCYVNIVLPNKVNAFAKTCSSKKQDDYQASKVLAEFGCVKQLDLWQPPHQLYANLKQLTREKHQLQQELTLINNQLHAEETKAITSLSSIKRMKARSKLLEKQILEVEKEIVNLIDKEESIKERIENVCTIPGVGLQTVVTVIAETNGFNLVRNSRQLVSYAGLDIIQKISGTSVRGRAHISKRGNPHLRHCLYFPAFTAVKYNLPLQNLHNRIIEKQAIKMKGYVAVQRKLLMLIYTLWKKNEPYQLPIKFLDQPVEAALTELD
ncbi:MAG TPA: IS110 family transposase [Panacibacter sp.]|nr:IS110 family transposase [Panacibacter sp.]